MANLKWKVLVLSEVEKELIYYFKTGALSQEDAIIIKKWLLIAESGGSEALMRIKDFDDHALDGNRRGQRSSCFSYKGRILYVEDKNTSLLKLIKITPYHDYGDDK